MPGSSFEKAAHRYRLKRWIFIPVTNVLPPWLNPPLEGSAPSRVDMGYFLHGEIANSILVEFGSPLIPLDEQIHSVPLEIAPSEQYLERRRQLFEQALKRLPAEFRESLVLFEIERWSYKALAAALGVPVGTVMSRLSRARRRLQQELTNCQDAVPSGPEPNESFGCAR